MIAFFQEFMGLIADVVVTAWAVIDWIRRRPPIQELEALITGELAPRYWRGAVILMWAFVVWGPLTFALYLANVLWWHWPTGFSILGLLVGLCSAITLFYAAPIALVLNVIASLRDIKGFKSVIWDIWGGTEERFRGFIRKIGWILCGELIFMMYHQVFPVWRNLSVLPLMACAVIVMFLLARRADPKSRAFQESRIRPMLNALMGVFLALGTLSLMIRGPFDKLSAELETANLVLSRREWLPLALLIIVGIAVITYRSMIKGKLVTLEGKPDGTPGLNAAANFIFYLMWVYTGLVLVESVVRTYNMPRWPTHIIAGLVLITGGFRVLGLWLPKGATDQGKRALYGMALVTVVIVPVTIHYFGWTQQDRLVDNRLNVQLVKDAKGAVVQADTLDYPLALVKVCPTCGEVYGGAKASYTWCDKHVVKRTDQAGLARIKLVWLDEAPYNILVKIDQEGTSSRDIPKFLAKSSGPRGLSGRGERTIDFEDLLKEARR